MGQSKTKLQVVMCGLDNSGKTTIINQVKPAQSSSKHITATVGYNVETFEKGRVAFTVFDMGGAKKFRGLWETYYDNIDAVIFVVDSSDHLRLCVVKSEIQAMLKHEDIRRELPGGGRVPFLFFANKMDAAGAKTAAELVEILDLTTLMGDHPFVIFASNALKGTGVHEGFSWLQETASRQSGKAGTKRG
ncbi:ADP-ribosylation factor, putative [Trypanosoma equiperdum]|uniref:ADP-ribosylation factor-like protein 6 n=2 Tax=Trypanozoon TaxID=39700 RepID=Q57UH8_TRYB2|nr:ADP-ribosylation factor, putative [Trypanosoma brucei brucei TREU927]AAX70717.1 ADP-ribosylation factor, putative [Trypanosoma brucei]AAZ13270.1 ADP-ribosylation factor, putative [Trypanosoma brucei brucei TREU927]SCU71554.1 ADP-ribosylation factor, putative [Trypanosoma equiperdum]